MSIFFFFARAFFFFSFLKPLFSFLLAGGKASTAVEKEGVAHVLSTIASSSQTQSVMKVTVSGEVTAFFERFEERAPNPYPDWHFWRFEGSLVAYGDF